MILDYYQLTANCLPHNRNQLMQAMAKHRARCATVHYSGAGDSGDMETLTTEPAEALSALEQATVTLRRPEVCFEEGKYQYRIEEQAMPISEALTAFALDWVSQEHPGWENNDGGSGEVGFDCVDNTCTLEHNSYYTESVCYETAL